MSILGKLRFKDQAFKLREDAILDATTRILVSKGFDLMTMDDVASEVGISKPSLYKHFKSREDLVTEAMIRLLDGAQEFWDALPKSDNPIQKMTSLLEWAMRVRLRGGMPFLPSTSPLVRDMLTKSMRYVAKVFKLNNALKDAVKEAKASGLLRKDLPDDVILFSFYSRTCDPAVEYLRIYSKMDEQEIVEFMIAGYFRGVQAE
ncbi:MAG TPA: TetR/AcrR family transcriptional regulator [Burkholderiaceae bacterium]